ncbi:GWT1 glycosylphosphatidylinositol-anchored wall transfer protein [Nitzschia inconspicua]|uniref:GWT1 glycosylphosphatidylinositol-anchored wall transfer protein n=1 Tax=Nitzschia inconspicua TaxID=303405 RepID=A0A9K3L6P5_9STRA|nr:GWT1 glycosylphosphatidylinositol-anchored wall transfer protein [Nitzschia inconspicua]
MTSIKALKEASVTGHSGSSHPWEVLWVCTSAVTGCAMYNSIRLLQRQQQKRTTQNHSITGGTVLLEAVVVWFPMILAQSEYLYPYATIIMIVQASLFLVCEQQRIPYSPRNKNQSSTAKESSSTADTSQQQSRLGYLTLYRSSILYLTFIAILAVDFPALFPRRFCKTETEGYGLMDVGAASFCLSAGLVGAKRRLKQNKNKAAKNNNTIWKPFFHALPLVVIGMIRIVTNQELEYQEHVTEYGVHWNFFFTLGVLTVLPLILPGKSSKPSIAYPLIVMLSYQLALSLLQWQFFVEDAPRTIHDLQVWMADNNTITANGQTAPSIRTNNLAETILWLHSILPNLAQFLLANREGVLGCCGYLSLYYVGEWVGYNYLWNNQNTTNNNNNNNNNNNGLGLFVLSSWGFHLTLVHFFAIPVSRRSTNLGFCSWAVAHNVVLLYFLQMLERRIKRQSQSIILVPPIWDLVNRHGLIMFLVANLLTGLVNLTVPTLTMSAFGALIIVFLYICLVGMAAMGMDAVWTGTIKNGKEKGL